MFGGIVVIGMLGVVTSTIFRETERAVLPWRPDVE
jgi:ABC-type nitrate/sulfonate/bicarbonate transport system permease component